MAVSLARLQFGLARLGWAGALGAALVAGSLAYDATVVRAREARLEEQLQRNDAARRAAEAEAAAREATRAEPASAGKPELAPEAVAALHGVFDAAAESGLELAQGEYRLTEVREAGLRSYQLSLPVAGSYADIRAFIAQALNADPALALTAIQLRRERIEEVEVEAMINFTLYLEPGA